MESPGTRQGYDGMVGNGVGPSGIVRLARGDRAESSGSLSGSLTDQARDVPGTPYDQQQQQRQQQYQQQEGADTDKDTCGLAKKVSWSSKLRRTMVVLRYRYNARPIFELQNKGSSALSLIEFIFGSEAGKMMLFTKLMFVHSPKKKKR